MHIKRAKKKATSRVVICTTSNNKPPTNVERTSEKRKKRNVNQFESCNHCARSLFINLNLHLQIPQQEQQFHNQTQRHVLDTHQELFAELNSLKKRNSHLNRSKKQSLC